MISVKNVKHYFFLNMDTGNIQLIKSKIHSQYNNWEILLSTQEITELPDAI